MNKSERLNDMMLFLNDKNSFNLKDLMKKYGISRSTALRDVASLERIGMPIYSQQGRNGYYGILRNRLLSPIVFNVDEVFAMYFSMLTLRAYETTPFHLSLEKLKEKFENCLSHEKIEMLHKVERVFSLSTTKHANECPYLGAVLQYAIEEKVCSLTYQKNELTKSYPIQFFNISSSYGQWYATGYNFETDRPQVFRCDKIVGIDECNEFKPRPLSDYIKPAKELYKTNNAIDFEVEVSKKGADLFHKEHYPSMKLCEADGRYMIKGFYNPNEERFISNYFISYGRHMLSVKPNALKELIVEELNGVRSYVLEL